MGPDDINAMFELFGGLFITISCYKLYRQKKVRGVSFWHISYFTLWGFWNLYFYTNLEQWASLVGSTSVLLVNLFWLGQIIYYLRKEKYEV